MHLIQFIAKDFESSEGLNPTFHVFRCGFSDVHSVKKTLREKTLIPLLFLWAFWFCNLSTRDHIEGKKV